jgi:hypothetical protein
MSDYIITQSQLANLGNTVRNISNGSGTLSWDKSLDIVSSLNVLPNQFDAIRVYKKTASVYVEALTGGTNTIELNQDVISWGQAITISWRTTELVPDLPEGFTFYGPTDGCEVWATMSDGRDVTVVNTSWGPVERSMYDPYRFTRTISVELHDAYYASRECTVYVNPYFYIDGVYSESGNWEYTTVAAFPLMSRGYDTTWVNCKTGNSYAIDSAMDSNRVSISENEIGFFIDIPEGWYVEGQYALPAYTRGAQFKLAFACIQDYAPYFSDILAVYKNVDLAHSFDIDWKISDYSIHGTVKTQDLGKPITLYFNGPITYSPSGNPCDMITETFTNYPVVLGYSQTLEDVFNNYNDSLVIGYYSF